MKIKRYKKVNKYLAFYRRHFAFHTPYQVLIDGSFCDKALKHKVSLSEQVPKYFGDQVKLFTTICCLNEIQNMGRKSYGAHAILKTFAVRKCGHTGKPIPAVNCILSMVGDDNNSHIIVATNEPEITEKLRDKPGCPILYLKLSAMNLEKPSKASRDFDGHQQKKLLGSEKDQLETLRLIKDEILGDEDASNKTKKVKKKGGPNPLSVKKKKKKKSESSQEEEVKVVDKKESEKNKTRKRKRLKLAKHVKKLLDSHHVKLDGD